MSSIGKALHEILPKIDIGKDDFPAKRLRALAEAASKANPLPEDLERWITYRTDLKARILAACHTHIQQDLPLELYETKRLQTQAYEVRNIRFQTQKGVYATASLYVPAGTGKFPAVLVTHGHWPGGRRNEIFQAVALSLVTNGYVCLVMDAWGAGERTTIHGEEEYHGANLGASLLNIGETLMGLQLSDNIRGLDLLQSLDYVDADRMGATGASGGGNQAMWLAAVDERVRAVIPVVSVGTFESYVMNSNCVCELLPNGLTFTEEDGVLALIAPRALKIFSARRDTNPSFQATQMLKSYQGAKVIYGKYGVEEKCAYEIFDCEHGYLPEMRSVMLGWFNRWLKNALDDTPVKEQAFQVSTGESLLSYEPGGREVQVCTTVDFCVRTGEYLYQQVLYANNVNREEKLARLKCLIGLDEENRIAESIAYNRIGAWERYCVKAYNGKRLPVLLHEPRGALKTYRLFVHTQKQARIPQEIMMDALREGYGLVVLDLWGTGEQRSAEAEEMDDDLPSFHMLSRSLLWLGRSVMGEWVNDISLVGRWLQDEKRGQLSSIVAYKEAGVAALIYGVLETSLEKVITHDTPYSYRFDNREGLDFYSMAIHLPGMLPWGDVISLLAMNHASIEMVDARSMSGRVLDTNSLRQIQKDYALIQRQVKSKTSVVFQFHNDKK